MLVGLRDTLRQLQPVRHRRWCRPPTCRRSHRRRREHLVERTLDGTYNDLGEPADGIGGHPLRAQHPAERDRARLARGQAATQPARGQPGADDPPEPHRGDVGQRPGRGVAAVHDPRLVQPREEPDGQPLGGAARRRTTTGRTTRCASCGRWTTRPDRRRPPPSHPRSSTPARTGGTRRRSTAPTPGVPGVRPHRQERQAAGRAGRLAAAAARQDRRQPLRGARLLDRAGDAAERVHPRAQRGLRHASPGTTRRGPTTRSSSGPGS